MTDIAHSPLPWRITEPTEKKTREIVDAKGATVAKLTALDLPNAELIVASVNKSRESINTQSAVNSDESKPQETAGLDLERLERFG